MVKELIGRWRTVRDLVVPEGTHRRAAYDRAWWAVVRRLRPPHSVVVEERPTTSYDLWRARHVPDPGALDELRRMNVHAWPSMSVLLIGTGAALEGSRKSFDSQVYRRRQLCVGKTLQAALAKAKGDWVVLLAAGDWLEPEALFRFAEASASGNDVVYADEDRVDGAGRHDEPFFKPDWSPVFLTSMNYWGHAFAARRALVVDTGATDAYDLALRLAERTTRIHHLPRVLYNVGKPSVHEETRERRSLVAAIERRGKAAEVTTVAGGRHRVRYALDKRQKVVIVIPTRDRLDLLETTIRSILERSTYDAYEILVVDNGSSEPATLEYLAALPAPHRVLADARPFNWSALNNAAVAASDAPILLFLNNDVEVVTPSWIEAMLEHAQHADVGAVGCKLLYPDGKLQHAGVVLGIGGVASHAFRTRVDDGGEYHALSSVARECSAVTGACLMVRRDAFDAVGGFDETLGVAYNDVDFCLKLHTRGLRNIYTPWATLYHYESATRGPGHPPENEALFVSRWRALIDNDPFYSPNLSLDSEQFEVRVR